ncbi:homoserine kinase [Helicobacter pylori]|uniref:Homoserine kinase n=1 Tax=Helicobacter pylori Hp P-4 TaxID=992075 RepID=J0EXP9_HELPX|nr:homoserine kinase [Helicobacter pylori]EJC04139.1 homoserine kinase [Helicobacter pylori Hp P-4]EJC23605.1 homoserine kinase [Helicobacter pylori Hp P-4d]EJC24698.1 homoserine kinase [Helicobacter pylori Hp P-4c]EJC44132.1 homoserine kinase [Helicobacter pylori Hp M3]MUU19588.1 homoserine kinase [Helicobacter pylori]
MVVSVPATSANLGPGFDCLGLSLNLRNRFFIEPSNIHAVKLVGEGEGIPKFLTNNIFTKVFYEILKKHGNDGSFKFLLHNKVPITRGMGSSSAMIVGAVASAFAFLGFAFDRENILNTALIYENHPDNITPAVFGGYNAAFVEKKKVISLKTKIPSFLKAVMVIPNRAISTKQSRHLLPKRYSVQESVFNLSHASLMTMAIAQGKWDLLRCCAKDRMHQYKRMQTYPVLFAIQKLALENNALMSTLSGSGSSFFNMCYEEDAPKLKQVLSKKFPKFRVAVLDFDNDGVLIEKD